MQKIEASITGTGARFDASGLPVWLEGVLFHRGGSRDGTVAGTYEESLEPVLDPQRGLVGTRGVSTMRFFEKRSGAGVEISELASANLSRIVGQDAASGALLVESEGRVERGSGRFAGRGGVLRSASRVVLGPALRLEVELTLELHPGTASGAGAEDPARPEGLGTLRARLEGLRRDD